MWYSYYNAILWLRYVSNVAYLILFYFMEDRMNLRLKEDSERDFIKTAIGNVIGLVIFLGIKYVALLIKDREAR